MQTQNQKPLRIAAAVCLAACATMQGQALGDQGQVYGRFDAGANLMNDLEVDGAGLDLDFDTGMRFDFAGGYKITDAFAVELEVGFACNSVDSFGFYYGQDYDADISDYGLDLDLYQIPMLVNLSYTIPLNSPIRPFIGVGAGGLAAIASAEMYRFEEEESAFAFAYQAFAGINYRVSDNFDIGVIYKFMGSSDLEFDSFETDGIGAHMIGINLEWRF